MSPHIRPVTIVAASVFVVSAILTAQDKSAVYVCHTKVKARDYVFTHYAKR